jgi:catechol 2,3-dioxygenase-like lactoylglutathione lyase family enzyme
MPITLNHTIVPATDKHESARFLAALLGLRVAPPAGPFAPVPVNADLTLDFDDRGTVVPGHYAFLVDDATFDAVVARLAADPASTYGSGPGHGWDRAVNHLGGGRGVYARDPDGHSYELFTAAPAEPVTG